MRYEGPLYRPPSEANSYILQATIGCSWNHCTYCDMYRGKKFRVRELEETLADVEAARAAFGARVKKVFVADGDALAMDLEHWEPILLALLRAFPRLEQVSSYATAVNLAAKTESELARLRELGLSLLYIGPETGDDVTFKRIAKGADFSDHVGAARKAHGANMRVSAIFLLGAGGVARSQEHATGAARLITEMDPEYLSVLTLTIAPRTPLATLHGTGRFELPRVQRLLEELRVMVARARPTRALFRTNHASNYLPLGGELPKDRDRIVEVLDRALAGQIPLRAELARRL